VQTSRSGVVAKIENVNVVVREMERETWSLGRRSGKRDQMARVCLSDPLCPLLLSAERLNYLSGQTLILSQMIADVEDRRMRMMMRMLGMVIVSCPLSSRSDKNRRGVQREIVIDCVKG